jgi:hypothetical protein
MASRIISVRMCDAHRHPTILRLNASMMKQTYATPAHVGTFRQVGDPEPVWSGRGELPLHQSRVPCGRWVRPCRLHALGPGCTLDPSSTHQAARLVSTDIDPGTAGGLPELADPIDAVVVLPEADQRRGEGRVADRPRGGGAVLGSVVSARSHLQQAADGLDSERAPFDDVVLVRVDERDYFRCWR